MQLANRSSRSMLTERNFFLQTLLGCVFPKMSRRGLKKALRKQARQHRKALASAARKQQKFRFNAHLSFFRDNEDPNVAMCKLIESSTSLFPPIARIIFGYFLNFKSFPIPGLIGIGDTQQYCKCTKCTGTTEDHLHCYVWNMCQVCSRKTWFNLMTCKLYSRRWMARNPKLICFTCRWPLHQFGMSSGDIHRLLLP